MGTSTYSFGEESPLKFKIPDKLARRYNEAAGEWFKAQVRFNQKFGRKWNPVTEPIQPTWSKKQRKAWDEFAKVFKRTIEKQGPFHENDIMDDFLVKNVGSAASMALSGSRNWGRIISMAATGGALYVLLNGWYNDRS